MTNVTPVEQDDGAVLPLIGTNELVLGYDPENPSAGHGPTNKALQPIANTLMFLRRRVGVQGTWDMTPVDVGTTPDIAFNQEMTTAVVSTSQYTATPENGTSLVKLAGSTLIKKETASRSARLRASTNGGNLLISAIVFANHDATLADISSSILAAKVGTCTHLASLFLDNNAAAGAGAFKLVMRTDDPALGNRTQTIIGAGAYAALDEIYCTFDGTTGLFSASVNAGAPVAGTNVFDVSGTTALRMYVAAYHTANPPTMTDAAYDFDFSDNTGGRTGFKTVNDPAVPSDAADGKKYLVSAAGPYRGRSASSGDIVEFHTGMTAIQILPATPWTTALTQALINPYITANPSAVQEIIDASLASYIPPTVEFDIETEYASLGGAAPGEFKLGANTVGATFWSSNLSGAMTLLTGYVSGYVPTPGDTFYIQVTDRNQSLSMSPAAPPRANVSTDWDYAAYTSYTIADFMRTAGKRYEFVFKYVDGNNTNDKWLLTNPDIPAWSSSTVSGSPLVTTITKGLHGRPNTTVSVSSTGNGEVSIPLTSITAADDVEPFKIGQSCRLVVDTNTTRIRIIGNSAGADGITFTSNLPVQSVVVGAINEPAVDIIGVGHAITITYQGNETWHIFAPGAEEQAAGRLYMEGNATATPIAIAGTYYKIEGMTTSSLADLFTHTDNKLTYTGLLTKKVVIDFSASVTCATANQDFGIMIGHQGSAVAGTKITGKLLVAGDPVVISGNATLTLAPGEYVEVFATNVTDTNALTVKDLQLAISGVR